MSEENPGRRRTEQILDPEFGSSIEGLPLEEARARREECLAEREYLSYLRRMLHARLEILRAEVKGRAEGAEAPLVDRLPAILGADMPFGPSRGEALRLGLPEGELEEARRRVEGLLGPAAFSDIASQSDEQLRDAIESLEGEERRVSDARRAVMDLQDRFQAEVKARYKEKLSSS